MADYSTPMMFQPSNPFPIAYGADTFSMDVPSSLSTVGMETHANLFNGNFDKGMALWNKNLPTPTIFDSYEDAGLDETAQSNNEIVQKVLLRADSSTDFNQFEFFFVDANAAAHDRNDYSFRNFSPMQATTLDQMQIRLKGITTSPTVADVVKKYRPLGFFFTFVEKSMTKESKLVAYTLGGLCDVLNVWHVPTVPGTRLYFVLYMNGAKCQIVPYAGLNHPLEKQPSNKHPWNVLGYTDGVAIIDVGIVCANSGRPIQQEKNHNYLVDATSTAVPGATSTAVPSIYLPARIGQGRRSTDPTTPQIQGNILRVKLNAIYWQYFA